jgi:hypothetical protein
MKTSFPNHLLVVINNIFKNLNFYFPLTFTKIKHRTGGMPQVVERLPNKDEAWNITDNAGDSILCAD